MTFLSQPFICNKKTSCSISDGSAGDVGVVVVLTDIWVDNVADNITEITNNLDSKNVSRISVLEDQILVLKNSFSEENAERVSLPIKLKQLKKKSKYRIKNKNLQFGKVMHSW